MDNDEDSPKDEIWMRHEIRYALEHTPGFEDEGWEGDFGEVHADSGGDGRERWGISNHHNKDDGRPTEVVK